MERTELVPVQLPNGQIIQVEARVSGDKETDVSIRRDLSFQGVVDSIEGVSQSVTAALAKAKPDSATVEFGIDVNVESGQLSSLLVKGSGTATLTITLQWSSTASMQGVAASGG